MAGEIVIRIAVPDGINVDVDYVTAEGAQLGPVVEAPNPANHGANAQPVAPAQTAPGQAVYAQPVPAPAQPVRPQESGQVPACPQHGPMRYYAAGHNPKSGKDFSASYRCPVPQCPTRPVWGV